jgi:hypothetical protein
MNRSVILSAVALASALASAGSLSAFHWSLQDSPTPTSQAPPKKPDVQDSQAADSSAEEPKKTKKVWTNEDMKDVSGGAVSQVGMEKNAPPDRKTPVKPANPQMAAAFRKQITALQAQLVNLDKQIAELKSFVKGETPGAVGLQLHKGYSTEPIGDQIRKLEEKKKVVAGQIDGVFDSARKLGIQPGQLR